MPRKRKEEEDDEDKPKRGPQPPRLSFTIPARTRRKIRIAAAKADMEDNDWCRAVIVKAAERTMERVGLE